VRSALLQRGFAEFVGTFTLIFVGAGSIIATQGGNLTAIALAHVLAIGVMASAVGHISGGHFNPAVTFGFVVTRKIEIHLAAAYWFAQFVGAILAAFLLEIVLPQQQVDAVNLGAPSLAPGIGGGGGVVIEAVLTFFLVWVIFATAADPRGTFASIAGLAIGFTITLDVFMGGPYTGAAMNPARAVGPELVQNFWTDGWVYWLWPTTACTCGHSRPSRSGRRRPGSTSRARETPPRSKRHPHRAMRRLVVRWSLRRSNKGETMWWGIGIGAFLYMILLLIFGLGLAYKGRWVLFLIGFVFPIVWIVGYAIYARKPATAQA